MSTTIPWIQYTEPVVAQGHPSLADVTNRPLTTIYEQSGYGLSDQFYGFASGVQGTSSPVNVIAAPLGFVYAQTDAVGYPLWIKVGGGTGNTGWQQGNNFTGFTLTSTNLDVLAASTFTGLATFNGGITVINGGLFDTITASVSITVGSPSGFTETNKFASSLGVLSTIRAYGFNHGIMSVQGANGSMGSPTSIVNNDLIGSFDINGYESVSGVYSGVASFRGIAIENFTTSGHGTKLRISTAALGSTSLSGRFDFDYTGIYPIATNTYDLGVGALLWRSVNLSSNVNVGTTPALSGAIRLGNNLFINARDSGNANDYPLIGLSTGAEVLVGNSTPNYPVRIKFIVNGLNVGWQMDNNGFQPQADNSKSIGGANSRVFSIVLGSFISVGGNAAQTNVPASGVIRIPNNTGIAALNNAGSTTITVLFINTSDVVELGASALGVQFDSAPFPNAPNTLDLGKSTATFKNGFFAGTVQLGTFNYTNAPSATIGAAGGAAALPATPVGYAIIQIGGTNFKMPYYNT